jgi:outer membrane protein assembly factor BamE (lipoprotein component of BamABCDE complex)
LSRLQTATADPNRPTFRLPAARRALLPLLSCLVLSSLVLTLPGCSYLEQPPQVRGNKVDPDALKELVPGTTTRTDVTSLIGSPTAKATFDDNTWLYITETTQPVIASKPAVRSQAVVVLTFDQGGVLRDIKKLNQKDSKPVDVVSRSTPSPGSEASFMQQLLGNVGKFNPGIGGGGSGLAGSGTGL